AVLEGPPRELARLGRPRARRQHRPQDACEVQRAAMAVNLGDILARVRARGAHEHRQHVVEPLPADRIAGNCMKQLTIVAGAPDHSRQDLGRHRPRHPDDADTAAARRRRDGGDRVAHAYALSGAGMMRSRRNTPSPSLRVVTPGTLSSVMWMMRRSCGLIGLTVMVRPVARAFSPSRVAISTSDP